MGFRQTLLKLVCVTLAIAYAAHIIFLDDTPRAAHTIPSPSIIYSPPPPPPPAALLSLYCPLRLAAIRRHHHHLRHHHAPAPSQ